MSAVDFRRAFDVGGASAAAMLAVIVENPTEQRPILLELGVADHLSSVALDYSEAGQLFDTLAQAMGLVVAAHATPAAGTATAALLGVELAHDTPSAT